MKLTQQPQLIALVGGSGAGKTWLAQRLQQTLDLPVTRLSLDDFYLDQSHLAPSARERVNYDHPRQIDWRLVETVLLGCLAGRTVQAPRYSFVTHTRQRTFKKVAPKPIVLVDGLWLLRRPRLRHLFDVRVFLHCPTRLRLERRLQRDLATRGRDGRSVRRQFNKTVAPMHKRFVAPQAKWAEVVLHEPLGQGEVDYLAALIEDRAEGGVKNLCSATPFHCAQGSHDGAGARGGAYPQEIPGHRSGKGEDGTFRAIDYSPAAALGS
jgi:uridine kinase